MERVGTGAETEKQQLIRTVQDELGQLAKLEVRDKDLVESIVDACVNVASEDVGGSSPSASHLVVMAEGGRGGAVSRKLWNIRLTWRERAWDKFEQIGATSAAAAIVPWLGVLVVLIVAKTVFDLTEIHLSERHAMVLWASWQVPSSDHMVSVSQVLAILEFGVLSPVNGPFTEAEVGSLMQDLHHFECVTLQADGRYRLVESLELRAHLPAR
jgi:hypothetical protein